MSISNELSSEIATAILTAKSKYQVDLNDLKEIVVQVHSTLQQMTAKAKAARHHSRWAEEKEEAKIKKSSA
jgi:predicted transcriptional regulator